MITEEDVNVMVFTLLNTHELCFDYFKMRENSDGVKEYYCALFPRGYHKWITVKAEMTNSLCISIIVTPEGCEPIYVNLPKEKMEVLYKEILGLIEQNIKREEEDKIAKQQYSYSLFFDYVKRVEKNERHNN